MTAKLTLEHLAANTWQRIHHSLDWEISQGEETITDNLLLEMKMSKDPAFIKIEKCPKKLEAVRGIDWEWWIGSYNFGWIKYAVQAKKISLSENREEGKYPNLTHEIKTKLNKKKGIKKSVKNQIDVLEHYSKENKLVPLYCFYNYIEPKPYFFLEQFNWKCNLQFDANQLGCTTTPLKVVKTALNKIKKGRYWIRNWTFDYIHSQDQTLPWRCLVQCPIYLDFYYKNFVRNKRRLMIDYGAAVSNSFDDEMFGEVTVHGITVDGLPRTTDSFYQSEEGAKRLLIVDIDQTISDYIQLKESQNYSRRR